MTRTGRVAFRVAIAFYTAGLLFWLTLGLFPVIIRLLPVTAEPVTVLAVGGGPLAGAAAKLLEAAAMPGSPTDLLQYAFSLLNLVLGLLLVARRPDDLVPRLLALGLLGTAATFNLPSHEAFHVLGSPWPIATIHFTFHIVSGVAYLWAVVLFPDGRLPPRVPVPPVWLGAAAAAVTVIVGLICWWSDFLAHPQFFVVFFGIAIPVAGVAAQALRIGAASCPPATRRAARLLVAALLPALAVGVLWVGATVLSDAGVQTAVQLADRVAALFPAVFAIVPIVLFAGVLRYRLFDIDRLLSRVLVYGLLIAAAGLAYLVAVVSGSMLAGGAAWWTVLVLALAAAALEPLWSRARRLANRVVFGQDLAPTEALRTLIAGLEQVSAESELQQLVDVAVRATRATDARLWLRTGDDWALGAACRTSGPASGERSGRMAPVFAEGRSWPVTQRGELVGRLEVTLGPDERLPAAQRHLLADLAAHAGLLVRNAALARILALRVRDLADHTGRLTLSRRRLVVAQDRERRRIERDLHDGAQQTLVGVILGLRAVGTPGLPPAARAAALVQLRDQLDEVRTELDDIATGRGPAALREAGLVAALERAVAGARRTGTLVALTVDVRPDLPEDVATAVFFCCSEGLQNAVKYARADRIEVAVRENTEGVEFAVTDDGVGFDPAAARDPDGGLRGLDDRASLAGGAIVVDSAPGRGTRLRGVIPLGAPAEGPFGGPEAVRPAGPAGIGLAAPAGVGPGPSIGGGS